MKYFIALSLTLSIGFAKSTEEHRIKIAIVDTGLAVTKNDTTILCRTGHFGINGVNPFEDDHGHGTNIFSLVTKGLDPKKFCVEIIRFYPKAAFDANGTSVNNLTTALMKAIQTHPAYLNLSLAGAGYSKKEYEAIQIALDQGIKIAAAAGNDYNNLDKKCDSFPACNKFNSKNFHVVGSDHPYSNILRTKYSNYGRVVKYLENGTDQGIPIMSGTSQATAIHLNKWIKSDDMAN